MPGMESKSPLDFFRLFFSREVIQLIHTETRRYAEQYLERERDYLQQHPKARAHEWTKHPILLKEIEVFIAIVIAMGICGLPTLRYVNNMCKKYERLKMYVHMYVDSETIGAKYIHILVS